MPFGISIGIYIYDFTYMVNVCDVNSKANRFWTGSKSWLLFGTFIGTEAADSQINKPAH